MSADSGASALLQRTASDTCPACGDTLPLLVVHEWGPEPVLCQIADDGNLRLGARQAPGPHAVACINGPGSDRPRLIAHAARCRAGGLFARFIGPSEVVLLNDRGEPHGRPIRIRHTRDREACAIVARCLLTGRSVRLPGDGRATGKRVPSKRVAELTGLRADEDPVALHPLVAAAQAGHDAGALSPTGASTRVLVDAGVLAREIHAAAGPAFWWTSIGEHAADLQDQTVDTMRFESPPTIDMSDPVDGLLALWVHKARSSSGYRTCSGIDAAAHDQALAALNHHDWLALAGIDSAVQDALRAAHDTADRDGHARLEAWRTDGPHSAGLGGAADQQLALL